MGLRTAKNTEMLIFQ